MGSCSSSPVVARESSRQPRSRSPGFLEVRTKALETQVRLGTAWQAHLPGHKHSEASTSLSAPSCEDRTSVRVRSQEHSCSCPPVLPCDTLGPWGCRTVPDTAVDQPGLWGAEERAKARGQHPMDSRTPINSPEKAQETGNRWYGRARRS